MARLRIYTVHVNPSLPHPYEAAEFVREGFSVKAFLFTSLWALYHRLWLPAAVLIAYNCFIFYALSSNILSHTGIAVIDVGVHLIIGFEANEWIRTRLKHKGYLTADITAGDSALRAEQRFFDRYFAAHPGAPF
jgi:hypothetical protein